MENIFFISEFLSITNILWRGAGGPGPRGPLQRIFVMLKNSLIKKIFSTPSTHGVRGLLPLKKALHDIVLFPVFVCLFVKKFIDM